MFGINCVVGSSEIAVHSERSLRCVERLAWPGQVGRHRKTRIWPTTSYGTSTTLHCI